MEYAYLLEQISHIGQSQVLVFDSSDKLIVSFAHKSKENLSVNVVQIRAQVLLNNPLLFDNSRAFAAMLLADDNLVIVYLGEQFLSERNKQAPAQLVLLKDALNVAINLSFWSLSRLIEQNASKILKSEEHKLEHVYFETNVQNNSSLKEIDSLTNLKRLKSLNIVERETAESFRKINFVRVNDSVHNSYAYELAVFDAVQAGDPKRALRAYERPEQNKIGKLGLNELKHYKTLVVIQATLAARAAIKGGLPVEEAFSFADHYIIESELCHDLLLLKQMVKDILYSFAKKVQDFKALVRVNLHPLTNQAIEFIAKNIFTDLKVVNIAQELHVSADHLQRTFKRDMLKDIHQYVLEQKVKYAQELLVCSNMPLSEIADLLNFSSASHFSSTFKKFTKLTPSKFKQKFMQS